MASALRSCAERSADEFIDYTKTSSEDVARDLVLDTLDGPAVSFPAYDNAGYITGRDLRVDGGLTWAI
ncbi:hypothetical protein [Roseomonas elaeocarpi]|uniref:Uncharacterized protein n=1 Tax=Roseomonas elaeocarpi TaxID=907779 RepID=A0ABV6JN90_9PROT